MIRQTPGDFVVLRNARRTYALPTVVEVKVADVIE